MSNDNTSAEISNSPRKTEDTAEQTLSDSAPTPEALQALTNKYESLTEKCQSLESQLEAALRQKDAATKEKETVVIKYAVSEKTVLDLRRSTEVHQKKHSEATREIEILQHKIQTLCSEKTRICQLLDDKCYELKAAKQELEHGKSDLGALETKLKWAHSNLKSEIELHESTKAKFDELNAKFEGNVKTEVQVQYKDEELKLLTGQFEKLQSKHEDILQENNELSLKVQQLERERLECEQKLREFKAGVDKQKQDCADLQTKETEIDQLQLQLKNEQHRLSACNEQAELLRQRNSELEREILTCRDREAELLYFTQQLTDKNVRLQSEFTALETKIQQFNCEQTLYKRSIKEHETSAKLMSAHLNEERTSFIGENSDLRRKLSETLLLADELREEIEHQKEEKSVLKRKFELALRESGKELQVYRKKCEDLKSRESSSGSSNLSLNAGSPRQDQAELDLDEKTLIAHILKLQRISAKKSEKIDFLEEHVNALIMELQNKSRMLHDYALKIKKQ